MFHTVLLLVLIIAICMALLSIRLLLGKKDFVHTHVEGNKALAEKGISCAKSQHKQAQQRSSLVIKEHNK